MSSSLAMSEEAQSSIDALPFRQGALDAREIRSKCPQFCILIIGKANAGKMTILRKVCNAKPDVKPIVYDAGGKEVQQAPTNIQQAPTKVGAPIFRIRQCWKKLTKFLGSSDSRGSSRCLNIFIGRRSLRIPSTLHSTCPLMSSILQLRLSGLKPFIIISDDLLAWRT